MLFSDRSTFGRCISSIDHAFFGTRKGLFLSHISGVEAQQAGHRLKDLDSSFQNNKNAPEVEHSPWESHLPKRGKACLPTIIFQGYMLIFEGCRLWMEDGRCFVDIFFVERPDRILRSHHPNQKSFSDPVKPTKEGGIFIQLTCVLASFITWPFYHLDRCIMAWSCKKSLSRWKNKSDDLNHKQTHLMYCIFLPSKPMKPWNITYCCTSQKWHIHSIF